MVGVLDLNGVGKKPREDPSPIIYPVRPEIMTVPTSIAVRVGPGRSAMVVEECGEERGKSCCEFVKEENTLT